METKSHDPPITLLFFKEDGAVQALVDCGGMLYHLAVQYNYEQKSCLENSLLEHVYNSLDAEDDAAVSEARDACMAIVKPFMLVDYVNRVKLNRGPTKEPIKLRAVTKHGRLVATNHELELEYPPTKPIENEYPNVRTVPYTEIEEQEVIDHGIFKVKFGTQMYCLKSVHRKLNVSCFKREIQILKECLHPNIVSLIFLVTDQDGNIEAMLLEYITNAQVLSNIDLISADQYRRWTKEIEDGIMYLHNKDLVWGDVKPENVLIREDGSVVLIDFGGGYTNGWVDEVNYETAQGDWQGYRRIVEFLKARIKTKMDK